ncbi:Gfo/Idh/MocA family oxidoreductase [Arthrobacter sp. TB 26]|uniref:Gfo/Idh/MocA family protein n=1 Tax=Arthrobacter sp. TB 26 TaxID=494420 RepID=UPI0009FFB6CA|nr:Gfo/Idh/MocA family oxidoreductase [Arthrobacter sp. TB 26]
MTLGVALLGAGRIGAVHAGAIAQHSDSKLLYVRSRHPDTERLAARYHAHAVTDLDTIWGDPAVDAVVIATPTPTHCDLIEQAVAAGKAVLCEKPIDQNIERVEETWKRIGAEGASRVRIGFNRRFDPTFQLVREQLDAGSAGRLEAIHIVTRVVNPPSYRYVQGSGGLFRDMTIHDLDLLRFLVDEEPTRIYAAGSALVDPELAAYDDIDSAKLLLEYDSGMLVTIENSRRSAYGFDGRVEIFGSSGQVTARESAAPQTYQYQTPKAPADVHDSPKHPTLLSGHLLHANGKRSLTLFPKHDPFPVQPLLTDGRPSQSPSQRNDLIKSASL